jgi:Flp pilus assembly protein TadD
VTLKSAGYSIQDPDKQQALSLVKTAQTQLLSKSIDRLILPYQSMVANNPENISARMQIAILYTRYGLYDSARQVFDVLLELAPEHSAVYSNYGNLYLLSGSFESAISSYLKAIKLDETDGGIWLNLSMANYRKGDLKTAAANFQQAISLSPELKGQYSAYSKLLSQ